MKTYPVFSLLQPRIFKIAKILLCVVVLPGCGGESSDELMRGVVLDGPVAGLRYSTGPHSGTTDQQGAFFYEQSESVVFSIGELTFPAVTGAATITPLELVQANDIEDESVLNLLRLLQSIDSDQIAENGITISNSVHDTLVLPQFSFSGELDIEEFLTNVVDLAHDNGELVTKEAALDHFIDTLTQTVETVEIPVDNFSPTYLVEMGEEYQGHALSMLNGQYAITIDQNTTAGSVEQANGVLRLKSENNGNHNGNSSQFLTAGVNESGENMYCLANRPYAIAECEAGGRLFTVFTDEASAIAHKVEAPEEELSFAAAKEQAAEDDRLEPVENNGDQPEEIQPEQTNAEVTNIDADIEVEEVEGSGEQMITVEVPAVTQTQEENNSQTGFNIDNEEGNQVEAEPEKNTETPDIDPPTTDETTAIVAEDIITTSNCPSVVAAPTQITVYADEPTGCQWAEFDGTSWSWTPATAYDANSNTVTVAEGGLYQGDFTHTCTDKNTGLVRAVKTSCVVNADDAPGIEDITDLFFITGQANATGLETSYDVTLDAPDSRVFAFTEQGWQVADLHQYWEETTPGNFSNDDPSRSPYNSIAFQLSRALAEKSGRIVGLVVLTAPGEGISHWDYNSEFFSQMREKATAALNALPHKNTFDGIIWMQGETDWMYAGTADPGATGFESAESAAYTAYYPTKLFQLINNLRSENWLSYSGKFVCTETKKANLNQHLMDLNNDNDAFTGCAAAADLPTRSSDAYGNHFSADALRTLGQRIADVYLSMIQ